MMDNPPWSADADSRDQRVGRVATAAWVAAIVLIIGVLWLVFRWEPIGMSLEGVAEDGRTLQVIPRYTKDDCDLDVRVSLVEETPDKVVLTASQERFLLPNFVGG